MIIDSSGIRLLKSLQGSFLSHDYHVINLGHHGGSMGSSIFVSSNDILVVFMEEIDF